MDEEMSAWTTHEIPALLDLMATLIDWCSLLPYGDSEQLIALEVLHSDVAGRLPHHDPLWLAPYWSTLGAMSDLLDLHAACANLQDSDEGAEEA
jgi:hypothetical protein